MSDVRSATFFRPWSEENISNYKEAEVTKLKKILNSKVKFESEEVSGNESESSHCSNSGRESGSSFLSRSPSVTSADATETSSLHRLSNFVFNAHPDNELKKNTDERNFLTESENYKLSRQGKSMECFYEPNPVYTQTEHLTSFKSELTNFEGATNPFHGYFHHFHRGLPAFSTETYASVEEAVKYIQQQEVVAKQMKKLRPKKFRCSHCDVAFSNNGQLKGHIRIHTGERPFKCEAEGCGKSFTRNEELTRHKRIHTGLRPHSCMVCGKRFGRKDHLKKHTRTHENRGSYHVPAPIGLGHFAIGGHPFSSPYLYI